MLQKMPQLWQSFGRKMNQSSRNRSLTSTFNSMLCIQVGGFLQNLSTLDFRELLDQTCQIANVLRDVGVKKGDKVMIYMPAMPLAVAAMLACARMGAVHW